MMEIVDQAYFFIFSSEQNALVRTCLFLTVLMGGVALLLFLFILISRMIDHLSAHRKHWMEKKAQQLILSYLFHEGQWEEKNLAGIRKKYLSYPFRRRIFLRKLLALHKNLEGQSAERLRSLYQALKLHHYAYRKIYASNWEVIAKGIRELSQMRIVKYKELIGLFINHPVPIVRAEAQIALVHLDEEATFAFLKDLKVPIPEWQQFQLIEIAHKLKRNRLPDFKQWLDSEQESIVIFCIRMIAQFNQFDAAKALLNLLEHPSRKLRKEAVIAIRTLGFEEVAEKLSKIYMKQGPELKEEIRNSLQIIDRMSVDDQHLETQEATKYVGF